MEDKKLKVYIFPDHRFDIYQLEREDLIKECKKYKDIQIVSLGKFQEMFNDGEVNTFVNFIKIL